MSEQTILHVHRVLSKALSDADLKRLIEANPMARVRSPRPFRARVGSGALIRALNLEQLERLLCGFGCHPLYPIVAIAAATGMRRREILALRWQDFDANRKTLRVERAVEETNKFGMQFKPPKNRSSLRTISIDAGLVETLQGLPRTAELIFGGKEPLRPRNVSRDFGSRARSLGFSGIRFHDLRHTHASLLLARGMPVNAVAARLGHSSPVITLSVYSRFIPQLEQNFLFSRADK